MRDCAHDASMALSAFGSITRGHTALTSECGSMLEEVKLTEQLFSNSINFGVLPISDMKIYHHLHGILEKYILTILILLIRYLLNRFWQ